MPVYRCTTPAGTLFLDQRHQLAKAFTDVHCNTTGAPRKFVQVMFFETAQGEDSEYETPYFVDGGNRAGRSEETKQTIMAGLTQALSEIGNIPNESIGARISEGPASWTMEGGHILPEPGEEGEEWYAEAERV